MTDEQGQQQAFTMTSHALEILSAVSLPTRPTSTPAVPGSSSTNHPTSEKRYRHVLPLRAVNPRMDLVAIVSRDVNTQSTGTQTSQAGLPPPPAGMNAARSQALMRMRMAARAKALAAAGLPATSDAEGSSAGSSAIKIARCATLRLSLWRMASVAGEQGTRVWDVAVSVPERFEEPGDNERELEDMSVEASCWSPDGRALALIVSVSRRDAASTSQHEIKRHERLVCLYALHDGKRISVVPIAGSAKEACTSLEWRTVRGGDAHRIPGTADYILHRMGPLLDLIPHGGDDQESKAKQRQRMFQALRSKDKSLKQDEDKKADELITTDPRGLGRAILQHPRRIPLGGEEQPIRNGSVNTEMKHTENTKACTLLHAICPTSIHALLDGTFYLGTIDIQDKGKVIASSFDEASGLTHCTLLQDELGQSHIRSIDLQTHLLPHQPSFNAIRTISVLSTYSFNLSTYAHDALVLLRGKYKAIHEDCIAPWNRQARLTSKRYATELSSEILMLLCTGFANDTILLILLGNEAMSEKDLKRMEKSATLGFDGLIKMSRHLTDCLQRMIVVYEEVSGCAQWHQRFGFLFGLPDSAQLAKTHADLAKILKNVEVVMRQTASLTREVKQECMAWKHFYVWWTFERSRQEALRDKKSAAEALAAAGGEPSYDVMLLLELIRRGFDNYRIEQILGIAMDARTRGTEVEDGEEEEDEEERRGGHASANQRSTLFPQNDRKLELAEAGERLMDASNASEVLGESRPWYQDDELMRKLQATVEQLGAPPKASGLINARDRQVPLASDVAHHTDLYAGLYAGPSSQLHSRLTRGGAYELQTSIRIIREVLSTASALFSNAFRGWAQKVKVSDKCDRKSTFVVNRPLLKGGTEALESLAGNLADQASNEDEVHVVLRVSLDSVRSQHHMVLCIGDGSSATGSSIVFVKRHLNEEKPMVFSRIRLAEGEQVTNVNFYSFDEVAVLVEMPKSNTSKLVTIRIDELEFEESSRSLEADLEDLKYARYARSAQLNDEQGGKVKFLSTNRFKDVCATLDDEGHLTYLDMVLQQPTEEEDGV